MMKRKIRKIFPFWFLLISSLISFLFTLGVGLGYSIGVFFTKKIYEGKFRPIILYIKNWEIHLHHWFLSFLILIFIFLTGIYMKLPSIFYGFLGGLIIQDVRWDRKLYKKHIYWNKKWYKILSKNKGL